MFQSFEATTSPDQGPDRLKKLRQALDNENIQGFIVPRADAHQGEYVAARDARLEWLTGFTGSAGFAAVLPSIAGVFIDGRYRVQVKEQVSTDHFTPVPWPETKPADWIKDHLSSGKVGFDPWLFTKFQVDAIRKGLEGTDVTFCETTNLIDLIWDDQPAPPQGKAEAYPIELSGQRSPEKRAQIAEILRQAGQNSAVLTLPDSICWLLNIRGSDIPRIPIAQCFAVIHDNASVDLFIDSAKVADLGPDPSITIQDPSTFSSYLRTLQGKTRVDETSAPYALSQLLSIPVYAEDPCILPKACKNETEIEGARTAHIRDAAAMIEFLAWLDSQTPSQFSEIDVVQSLEGFRAKTNALRDISFETISGAGPNGAVVHYRVTDDTNRTVNQNDLLLVDSGGQYVDGTTDITRTIAIGTPSRDQQECFTRVLQGMIALSRVRFPRGVSGRDLDPLARAPLWMVGQDYDHGTGHGVGAFLSVHEGPQRISRISEVPLQPGMILSNEPGYYREGEFGIRIENLIVVQEAPKLGDNRDQLNFETLTWVPIDRRLIAKDLLGPAEITWINTYHATIADKITIEGPAANWLKSATAPL
jgi:Xaa-Pro aminopeptidase